MAGNTFYCILCGTCCPVACYPTHCDDFTCHNTSCSAHNPPYPKKPEEKAISYFALGWSDGHSGIQGRPDAPFQLQNGSTDVNLDEKLNNLSLKEAEATNVSASWPLSTAMTPRFKRSRRVKTPDQDPKSTKPQSSGFYDEEPSLSEIEPGLFLGNMECISESFLRKNGITAVITVRRSPIPDHTYSRLRKLVPLKDRLFLNADDAPWQDLAQHFPGACDFIDRRLRPHLYTYEDDTDARESDQEKLTLPGRRRDKKKQHKVLVHCRKGISRSASIVVAYLMFKKRKPHDQMIELVRRSRPIIHPNPGFRVQLQLWYDIRFQLYSNDLFNVPCMEYANLRLRLTLEELKRNQECV